jgi:hypothetical protein
MKKLLLQLIILFAFNNIVNAQLISLNGQSYFINGCNIPWHLYSQDFGTHYQLGTQYDTAWFENAFTQCQAHGINCTRFWLFTDGATSPEFDTITGNVTGLDTNFFSNLDDIFKRALKHNIMLIPSIWDFSMTNNDYALGRYGGMHASLIQDSSKTRSFINNALIPMVQRYANQCNLLAWEVINEPEWSMNVQYGGTQTQVVNASEMQRFVGMIAEAIHKNSTKMVTVGSASLRYNSDKWDVTTPCVGNYWKDQAIQNAYTKPLAYLDFYEIHYYDWMNDIISFDPYKSCCPESYWLLDKPTLIGESQGNSTKHTSPDELYDAYIHNWAGVLFWSFSAGSDNMGQFSDFNSALLTFRNTVPGIIDFNSAACNTTGINQSLKENTINIYPNPVTDLLNITGITNKTTVKLYDILGNLALEKETESNLIIDISLLTQGIYTLVTEDRKDKRYNKVVIAK